MADELNDVEMANDGNGKACRDFVRSIIFFSQLSYLDLVIGDTYLINI